MADQGEISHVRDWLDGQCQRRHETTKRELRREISDVRSEARDNAANIASIQQALAQAFGSGDRKGEIGRMQTDISELKESTEDVVRRVTRQEQLHYKILVTCLIGSGVAVFLLRGVELLLGNVG